MLSDSRTAGRLLGVRVKKTPLPRILVHHPHVRCDSRILGGSPHIADTRVPVRRVWAWHVDGVTIDTILKRYPHLGASNILDALSFAYDNAEVIQADIKREADLVDPKRISTSTIHRAQLPLPFDSR